MYTSAVYWFPTTSNVSDERMPQAYPHAQAPYKNLLVRLAIL